MRASYTFTLLPLLIAALSGCQDNITYSYLMRHPDLLQNESLRCSVTEPENSDDAAYCQLIDRAMTDLAAMAITQQKQPEKFGQLVMATETEYVNAGIDMRKATTAIHDAKNRLDKPALDLAQSQYDQAKKLRDQKYEELGVLFSILKAHSPE